MVLITKRSWGVFWWSRLAMPKVGQRVHRGGGGRTTPERKDNRRDGEDARPTFDVRPFVEILPWKTERGRTGSLFLNEPTRETRWSRILSDRGIRNPTRTPGHHLAIARTADYGEIPRSLKARTD